MKIGFFGAGKMAEGILSAIEDKKGVVMAEKVAERAADLTRKYGVATTADVKEVAKKAKFVFLAVRPQDVDALAAEVKPLLTERHTLVSIVAGTTLENFGGFVAEIAPHITNLSDAKRIFVQLCNTYTLRRLLQEGPIDETESCPTRSYLFQHTNHLNEVKACLALAQCLLPCTHLTRQVLDAIGSYIREPLGL